MRFTALLAVALAGLALSACTDRYYDGYGDRYGYDDRYYGPPPAYDRDHYGGRYYGGDRYDDRHNDRY